MAFSVRNLSVLAYANGFTLWHFKSEALPAVDAPGFFDAAADLLASGDIMMVSAPDGARIAVVDRKAGGVMLARMA
jgi:hypothetical protein